LDWDGELTGTDIDLISAALRGGSGDLRFDLTGNGTFDAADRMFLIVDLMSTRPGDTDLDGDVDAADMSTVVTGWTGTVGGTGGRGWADGDADGNADVDSADLTELILQWTGVQAQSSRTASAVDALFATAPRRRSAFWAP
jgi:hypothetical protein